MNAATENGETAALALLHVKFGEEHAAEIHVFGTVVATRNVYALVLQILPVESPREFFLVSTVGTVSVCSMQRGAVRLLLLSTVCIVQELFDPSDERCFFPSPLPVVATANLAPKICVSQT